MTSELDLINTVNAKKARLARIKLLISRLQIKRAECEKQVENAEQAYIDFMDANGLVESECGKYKAFILHSERVEVVDLEAVPEAYIRTKVVREPDKLLIKKDAGNLSGANWLTINKVRNLQIRAKNGE